MDQTFLRIVKCLNSRKARYVIIGGNAAAFHGVPRGTFDLDVLIESTLENATRVLDALRDAGLGTADLTSPERILNNSITIFNDWIPVDVMTRVPGLSFETAWKNRVVSKMSGLSIPWVGRQDLIRSKNASARPVDLDDVKALRQSRPSRRKKGK